MYILAIGGTLLILVPLFSFLIVRYIVKVYVSEIQKLQRENEVLTEFLAELQRRSAESFVKLKEIDRRGSFESDDEVGFVFKFIRGVVTDIHTVLTSYVRKED